MLSILLDGLLDLSFVFLTSHYHTSSKNYVGNALCSDLILKS